MNEASCIWANIAFCESILLPAICSINYESHERFAQIYEPQPTSSLFYYLLLLRRAWSHAGPKLHESTAAAQSDPALALKQTTFLFTWDFILTQWYSWENLSLCMQQWISHGTTKKSGDAPKWQTRENSSLRFISEAFKRNIGNQKKEENPQTSGPSQAIISVYIYLLRSKASFAVSINIDILLCEFVTAFCLHFLMNFIKA